MTDNEFTLIVRDTKRIVLSAIEKNLAERFYHAIDDVAQETYFRAYRSLAKGSFRHDSSMETWLYAIARNESLRMNKKLMREEDKQKRSAVQYADAENIGKPDTSMLHESIGSLPAKYRDVMQLLVQGLKINEISDRLRIRPGTVKSRASRGRKMIQQTRGNNHERE